MGLNFMKKKPLLPPDILCADEESAKALAESKQHQESDPSVLWTEKLLSNGRWAAHAFRPGSNHETFLGYLVGEVFNPAGWINPNNFT